MEKERERQRDRDRDRQTETDIDINPSLKIIRSHPDYLLDNEFDSTFNKSKNRLYYKYVSKLTDQTRIQYTNYKNKLTGVIRTAKKEYYHDQFNRCKIILKEHGRSSVLPSTMDQSILSY